MMILEHQRQFAFSSSSFTRVMAEHEIWEPLQCKSVFNTYLSLGRSNQKVEESGLAFFKSNTHIFCWRYILPGLDIV